MVISWDLKGGSPIVFWCFLYRGKFADEWSPFATRYWDNYVMSVSWSYIDKYESKLVRISKVLMPAKKVEKSELEWEDHFMSIRVWHFCWVPEWLVQEPWMSVYSMPFMWVFDLHDFGIRLYIFDAMIANK